MKCRRSVIHPIAVAYVILFTIVILVIVFRPSNSIITTGIILIIGISYLLLIMYQYIYIIKPINLLRNTLADKVKKLTDVILIKSPIINLKSNEITCLISYFAFFIKHIDTCINVNLDDQTRVTNMINSINVGIVKLDVIKHTVLDINQCALDTLGLTYDRCIGSICYEFLGEDASAALNAGTSDISHMFEGNMFNVATGAIIPVLKSVVAIEGNDGHETSSILFTFIDVSEMKAKEQELTKAVGRADRATMGKTILLGNVSHDIGNILTALKGNAEILQRSELNEEQHTLVEVMIDSSSSIANAVDLMRERTLLETGVSKLNLQPINISVILMRIYRSCLIKCQDKNVNFIYDGIVDSTGINRELYINVDSAKLQAVITNMLDNAVKFTNIGYIKCSIQVLNETELTYSVNFKITDTGIGISKESIESIFNIYEQANETIQSEYGGTGIGLSICQHYVKMMGGDIEVESNLNDGSMFSFKLILDKCSTNMSPYEVAQHYPARNTDQLRILVAEDSTAIQIVINDKLTQLNCETTIVSNGNDAVNLIREQYFDMLFLDIRMPVMSGMDAIEIIRDEKFQLPIIALTANSSETDLENYKDAGFDGHVPKPVIDETLNAIIMKFKYRQLLDLDYIKKNYRTSDFYLQILDSAKDEFKMNIEMLILFADDTNFTNVQHYVKAAHAIKSIASQIGMESVRHIAHILENKFTGGINFQDVGQVNDLVSLLQIQFQNSLEYYDDDSKS